MTEQELVNIDKFVVQLRETQQAVYMSCDAELAAVVCLRTTKAIKLIHSLLDDNLQLKNKSQHYQAQYQNMVDAYLND